MFLDWILRPGEIKDFEGTLKPHQPAKIALSSNDKLASAVQTDNEANDPSVSKRMGHPPS
jgi:COP9 signalosome complex subunit 4